MWTDPGGAQETGGPCTRSCARTAGRDCLGTAPVNSVYVFDDRVVLNINFTDDAKTVTREEVLGSSAVDNAPPYSLYPNPILYEKGFGYFFVSQDVLYADSMQNCKQ